MNVLDLVCFMPISCEESGESFKLEVFDSL